MLTWKSLFVVQCVETVVQSVDIAVIICAQCVDTIFSVWTLKKLQVVQCVDSVVQCVDIEVIVLYSVLTWK